MEFERVKEAADLVIRVIQGKSTPLGNILIKYINNMIGDQVLMNRRLFRKLRYATVLITILCLVSTPSLIILGEEQTISTGKRLYVVGETVSFSGGGLNPDTEYLIQIYHEDSLVQSIEFNSTGEGLLPADLSWNSSSSEPGTYIVKLLDLEGDVIGEAIFGLVEINKLEFMPEDSITIIGGGAEPHGLINVTIVTDSNIVFNVSVTADENGEFNVTIPLPFNITTGDYSVGIYIISEAAPDVTFHIFVNATAINMMNVTASELEDLVNLVSGINVTIRQSLLAKLQNALKKVEQAELHLSSNRTHVSKNMLKAAENMLNALLNEIRAQSGKHLGNETAAYLNSSIQEVVNKLKVMRSSLDKSTKGEKNSNHVTGEESSSDSSHGRNDKSHRSNGCLNGKKKGHSHSNYRGRGKGKDKH